MLSDGQARPGATADVSATAKPAPEARETKDDTARAAKPAAGAKRVSAAASDEVLAKEALEGLKRIRAKARLDKMAISKPAPTVIKPAIIVAKPPPPRPTWVAPLATLAVAAMLVVCACTGVIAYLTTQPAQNNVAANTEIRICARPSRNCASRCPACRKISMACAPRWINRARRPMTVSAGLPRIWTVSSG